MSQTIGSLRKALDLVDEFSLANGPLGVSELARRLGMSKNQVFRILKTLEEYDYVHQREDRSYDIGYRFFEIGQRIAGRNDLLAVAPPFMDALRDATQETVHLFARDGLRAVCLARRESPHLVSLSAQVGRRFSLHAGACPKTILAYQPRELVDALIARDGLPAYTERTITDRDTLIAHLDAIVERGYAESDEDLDQYAYAIAVPIVDRDGKVNAALSVAGPVQRFTPEMRARTLSLLVEACDNISAALGAPRLPSSKLQAPDA